MHLVLVKFSTFIKIVYVLRIEIYNNFENSICHAAIKRLYYIFLKM